MGILRLHVGIYRKSAIKMYNMEKIGKTLFM